MDGTTEAIIRERYHSRCRSRGLVLFRNMSGRERRGVLGGCGNRKSTCLLDDVAWTAAMRLYYLCITSRIRSSKGENEVCVGR